MAQEDDSLSFQAHRSSTIMESALDPTTCFLSSTQEAEMTEFCLEKRRERLKAQVFQPLTQVE